MRLASHVPLPLAYSITQVDNVLLHLTGNTGRSPQKAPNPNDPAWHQAFTKRSLAALELAYRALDTVATEKHRQPRHCVARLATHLAGRNTNLHFHCSTVDSRLPFDRHVLVVQCRRGAKSRKQTHASLDPRPLSRLRNTQTSQPETM